MLTMSAEAGAIRSISHCRRDTTNTPLSTEIQWCVGSPVACLPYGFVYASHEWVSLETMENDHAKLQQSARYRTDTAALWTDVEQHVDRQQELELLADQSLPRLRSAVLNGNLLACSENNLCCSTPESPLFHGRTDFLSHRSNPDVQQLHLVARNTAMAWLGTRWLPLYTARAHDGSYIPSVPLSLSQSLKSTFPSFSFPPQRCRPPGSFNWLSSPPNHSPSNHSSSNQWPPNHPAIIT
jgi:hypothetical protein